jgi:glycerophosphoryl diester phosphodiesterase
VSSFQRIGHGGASALARANTIASFDAAVVVGVDMIEFDVRAHEGELVLAHTLFDVRWGRRLRLSEALRHLGSPAFDGIELGVDLKRQGCEAAVLEAVRAAGLLDRAVFCSQVPPLLDRLRQLEPCARVAISVGGRAARLSQHWGDWRAKVLAGLAQRRWDLLMAQHRLVDRTLVDEVSERGAKLVAWTVNERPAIDRLQTLGVHGIATADPRLFV